MSDHSDAGGPSGVGVSPPGFRLPPETRPGAATLQVTDLDRSLAFYREVLGLTVMAESGGTARLGAADREILVLVEDRGAKPLAPRSRLGLFHFALLLPSRPDLGRFLRHLGSLGVPMGASDHAVSEAIYLSDPDGLNIEVYRDRPREEWRSRGRELTMATEPLDTGGVMAAGGREPWTELPAGSRIGHVHLHVGGLDEAEAFYHDALGLDKVVWSYPGALFLSAGGYHHHLGVNTWARGAPPAGEDDVRLLEWQLVLPDPAEVEAAARSLTAAGHAAERDAEGVLARDPWGTAVRLVPAP